MGLLSKRRAGARRADSAHPASAGTAVATGTLKIRIKTRGARTKDRPRL
jgi:hypothetical protein